MAEQTVHHPTENKMTVTKGRVQVTSRTVVGNPVGYTLPSVFARKDFEKALDRVSRPEGKPDRAS